MAGAHNPEPITHCAACGGQGYLNCACWPGDCICGNGDVTCEECMGDGVVYPDDDVDFGESE